MNGQPHIQGNGYNIWTSSPGPSATVYPSHSTSSHGQFLSSSSSSSIIQTPAFSANTHPHFHTGQFPDTTAPPFTQPTMQTSSTSSTVDEELQKLSQEYRPEASGPLVGERQSSEAIPAEYRDADPVYVQKTLALSQKFSHYRAIRGDGNCGWRALAFGYFETLLRCGGSSRMLEQQTRLKSLNNLLTRVGFEKELFEDFADETFKLLSQLASLAPAPIAASALLKSFNNDEISSAIITHFRLLTSAWMKTHAENYLPFIVGTVAEYCQTQIEPYQVEIEHVGMNALIDVLVKPAGFAVEISYLDRSPGHEVNTHRFEETSANAISMYPNDPTPTIYLLYRPGHYDILYDLPQTQVNLLSGISHFNTIQTVPPMASPMSNYNAIMDIPFLSYAALPGGGGGMLPPTLSTNQSISNQYSTCPISPTTSTYSPTTPGLALRPSRYQREAELHASTSHTQHYQTPAFKNSLFNPAHFRSNEFQPEIWTPELEGAKSPKEDSHKHL